MTIHAFTELHNDYPAFVNLSAQPDGTIKMSVRTRGNGGKEYASINLTDAQAEDMAEAIFKHVYAADAPPNTALAATVTIEAPTSEPDGYLYRVKQANGGISEWRNAPRYEWHSWMATKYSECKPFWFAAPVSQEAPQPEKVDADKLATLVAWFLAGKLPEDLLWNVQVTAESLRKVFPLAQEGANKGCTLLPFEAALLDANLYGTGVYLTKPDGSTEYVDPSSMYIVKPDPDQQASAALATPATQAEGAEERMRRAITHTREQASFLVRADYRTGMEMACTAIEDCLAAANPGDTLKGDGE